MGSIMSCVSQVMYMGEKFILYLVGTAMITCLIITFIVTLGMGVGLGYNYCFVDMKTKYKYVPGRYIYPASEKPEELEDSNYDATTDEDAKQNQTSSDSKRMRANTYIVAYDNQTEINKQPVSSDAKSINGTPSLEDVFLDAVTKYDETTKASQNIPDTNGSAIKGLSLRFCTVTRTTSKTHDMLYDSDVPTPEPELSPTQDLQTSNRIVKKLVIPISGLDLISLLTKLKAENNNYSLQLVTT